MEGPVAGGALVEGDLPGRLEVDGVGEDEPGQLVQHVLGDEVGNAFAGLVGDPSVDRLSCVLEVGAVIDEAHARAVVGGEGGEERLEEGEVLLAPEGVGGGEFEGGGGTVGAGLLAAALGEGLLEGVEAGVKVGGEVRMEDGVHLLRGLAGGADARHGEGDGGAVRGEDEVVIVGGEDGVEVGGECGEGGGAGVRGCCVRGVAGCVNACDGAHCDWPVG